MSGIGNQGGRFILFLFMSFLILYGWDFGVCHRRR
jgi:hypothetical protein